MSKRKVADTTIDPTLPSIPIEIGGKAYKLCFDLGALAEAEAHFKSQGQDVNLLCALPNLDLSSIHTIFPCAVRKFHPELGFEEAQKLITFPTLYVVAAAVTKAWQESLPVPVPANKENPPQPEA